MYTDLGSLFPSILDDFKGNFLYYYAYHFKKTEINEIYISSLQGHDT